MNWKSIIPIVFALALAGCSQESKQDWSQAGDHAKQAAEKAGSAIERDAKTAAGAVADKAGEVSRESAEGMLTGKVRNAIVGDTKIQIDDLDVDTANGTVTLHGKARDAASRSAATEIAQAQAGSKFKIDNQIEVKD